MSGDADHRNSADVGTGAHTAFAQRRPDTPVRILIVDDDARVRKTLRDILQVKGYDATAVTTGTEGIDAARIQFANIALIDLQLPDFSGIEVMERIKEFSAPTEVIILTGNASLDTAIEATNKGAFSYLLKPYAVDELLLHIRRGIEFQRTRDENDRLRRELELIVHSTGEGILTLDARGNHTFANPAAARMLGYRIDELIGRHGHGTWLHTRADGTPYPVEASVIQQTLDDGELRRRDDEVFWRKDGSSFCVEYVCAPIRTDKGISGVVVTFLDVTERKWAEREIYLLATTDPLTGIANRRSFLQALESEYTRARRHALPLALIMYDIDHFKQVNDRYGHDTGDAVLRTVADIVRSMTRADDVVARWGGEEFMILAPQTDVSSACRLAEKLRSAIAGRAFDRAGTVTASFGIAVLDGGGDTSELLKRVDSALYRAKENGRNRVEISAAAAPVG